MRNNLKNWKCYPRCLWISVLSIFFQEKSFSSRSPFFFKQNLKQFTEELVFFIWHSCACLDIYIFAIKQFFNHCVNLLVLRHLNFFVKSFFTMESVKSFYYFFVWIFPRASFWKNIFEIYLLLCLTGIIELFMLLCWIIKCQKDMHKFICYFWHIYIHIFCWSPYYNV